jgi:nicotinate phosphoribosyltransferase
MSTQLSARLDPAIFRLPVDKIREGYYSDAYFVHTKTLLEDQDHHPRVTMQVFQKDDSVLGGIDEAIAVLRTCAGHFEDGEWIPGWDELEVRALREGDEIAPYETVLTIEGDYSLFAHLETVYLGVMARRTLIMRNVAEVVAASRGKPIFYFPARHDHWLVQTGDGWAAHVAGAIGVSTDAQASWWGGTGIGTVPHGLIAAYGGDTVKAAMLFAERFAEQMSVTVLVDFDNDSVRTALDVAAALGPELWGVRLDTSETLVDRGLVGEMGAFRPTGVNPRLVDKVRRALDDAGFPDVRIVASGGFTAARIREFEAAGVPVDAYGVGSSLLRGQNDFTADVVMVDGRPCSKIGRSLSENPRLERVE